MAIRFLCSSCAQPIEIDDEWASKIVACPYCRTTVTAPSESQFDDISQVPTATGMNAPPAQPPPVPQVIAPPSNGVATAAVVLVCLIIAQYAPLAMIISAHQGELEQMVATMDAQEKEGKGSYEAQQVAMSNLIEANDGALTTWLMATSLLSMGMLACWIAAIVCGIIGAKQTYRRSAAVTSLIFCGVFPIVACCSSAAL